MTRDVCWQMCEFYKVAESAPLFSFIKDTFDIQCMSLSLNHYLIYIFMTGAINTFVLRGKMVNRVKRFMRWIRGR